MVSAPIPTRSSSVAVSANTNDPTFINVTQMASGVDYKPPAYFYDSVATFWNLPPGAITALNRYGPIDGNQSLQQFYKHLLPAEVDERLRYMKDAHLKDFIKSKGLESTQDLINGKRLEARILSFHADQGTKNIDDILTQTAAIVTELRETLVPKWHKRLDAFIQDSDAFVWLQLQKPRLRPYAHVKPFAGSQTPALTRSGAPVMDVRRKQVLAERDQYIMAAIEAVGRTADCSYIQILEEGASGHGTGGRQRK